VHAAHWRDRSLAEIFRRMRHNGRGGLPAKAERLTGIESTFSRPVRKIVLITNPMLRADPSRRR
jgi:hypothetical protein